MNIFEQASKKKLRFVVEKGNTTAEQLWGMELSKLDRMACAIKVKIDKETTTFLPSTTTRTHCTLRTQNLRLDIIKHIIDFKIQKILEADAERERKNIREQLHQLLDLKGNS